MTTKSKTEDKKCPKCSGYGWWAMGDLSPMGRLDANDGMPTIKCPWCNAGNITDDKRYRFLCDIKNNEK